MEAILFFSSYVEDRRAYFAFELEEINDSFWFRARSRESAFAFEEPRSVWDAVTSQQVRASNLPLIYIDVILKRISDERKAFYEDYCGRGVGMLHESGKAVFQWEQLHYGVVGRFIEKLMVLLRSSTMQVEEDVFKQTEVVERMYEAEVQGRVPGPSLLSSLWQDAWSSRLECLPQQILQQYFLAISTLLYAVVVSSVSLLVFVYRYLTGYVDGGGTLTCSSGSSQFRAIFISVVLFDGAYVWIKFRDVASTSSGVKRRSREDGVSGPSPISKSRRIEAKIRPPGQPGKQIYLSMCHSHEEAAIKKQIAAFLYGQDDGQLACGGGLVFQVPLTLREEGEGLSVEEKRRWVPKKVREVYQSFTNEKAIDPALHHFSDDAADFSSFLKEYFPGSPLQETLVPDSVMVSEDVYNGAATSNDGVLQESAFGEGAMVSCCVPAQEGVQNIDSATPAGVDFGMAEPKPNVFAMMVISCKDEVIRSKDEKIHELEQKIQKEKEKYQRKKQKLEEKEQKNQELEQRLREKDSRIVQLEHNLYLDVFASVYP